MTTGRPRRRRLVVAGAVLLQAACAGRSLPVPVALPATADTGTVAITRPTLIGFFPPLTSTRLSDSVFARTLSAFQAGLAHLRPTFERAGVAVYEQYTDTVVVSEPDRGLQIYVPPAEGVGYYLAAPGRDPDILQGLRSEAEIQEAVWRYFHEHGVRRASR